MSNMVDSTWSTQHGRLAGKRRSLPQGMPFSGVGGSVVWEVGNAADVPPILQVVLLRESRPVFIHLIPEMIVNRTSVP